MKNQDCDEVCRDIELFLCCRDLRISITREQANEGYGCTVFRGSNGSGRFLWKTDGFYETPEEVVEFVKSFFEASRERVLRRFSLVCLQNPLEDNLSEDFLSVVAEDLLEKHIVLTHLVPERV